MAQDGKGRRLPKQARIHKVPKEPEPKGKPVTKIVRKSPMDKLRDALIRLKSVKIDAKRLKADEEVLVNEVVGIMQGMTDKTVIVEDPLGNPIQCTLVEGVTLQLDKDGLKEDLTDEQWEACHSYVFDQARLEDLVAKKEIDAAIVEKHTTEVPRKPYPRIS